MLKNATILFCLSSFSCPQSKDAVKKPKKPEAEASETKPVNSSIYSGITDTVYNFTDNVTGWFLGGGENSKGDKNGKNDKKGM